MNSSVFPKKRHAFAALVATLALLPLASFAQAGNSRTLEGKWEGSVKIGTGEVHLILTVRKGSDGRLAATYRGIEQDPAFELENPALLKGTAIIEGDRVRFYPVAVSGVYEGRLAEDGAQITGTWTQAGGDPSADEAKAAAPQTLVLKRVAQPPKPSPAAQPSSKT